MRVGAGRGRRSSRTAGPEASAVDGQALAANGLPVDVPDQLPGGRDVLAPRHGGVLRHNKANDVNHIVVGVAFGEVLDLPELRAEQGDAAGKAAGGFLGDRHPGHGPRAGQGKQGLPLGVADVDRVGGQVDQGGHRGLQGAPLRRGTWSKG